MTLRLVILLITLFCAFPTLSKPRITTSTIPLASIVAMLVQDKADLSSIIKSSGGCPTHYSFSPSDLIKVKNSDLVIYIDDEFDGFISKLMNHHAKRVVKISDFKNLQIITNNSKINWHLWFDLNNVRIILEELAKILITQMPELQIDIRRNLQIAVDTLSDIERIKVRELNDLHDVILLDDSIEYFFLDKIVHRLYQHEYKSLQYINNLQRLIDKSMSKCLILTLDQRLELYKGLPIKLIQVNTENWDDTGIHLTELFYKEYVTIIQQVKNCNKGAQFQ